MGRYMGGTRTEMRFIKCKGDGWKKIRFDQK